MRILIAERTIDHVQNYANALNRIGMNFDISLEMEDLSVYDALLLPGGADIHPSRYNEEINGSVGIDEELDEGQFRLIDLFVKAKKPVFGICRGCQLINVYFGGSMIQHLSVTEQHKEITEGVDNQHFVQSVSGSEIEAVYGELFKVNSSHHQGCKDIGEGLKVTLWSEDGIVEALEHESLPVAGVQWHPERTCLFAEKDDIVDGELVIRHFLQK
ncbi:MAG: gamma-glutamyl-gamma-aminobutyrate hydrolase family protein [Lachnospiraceae bacterium]|nr:gamma-glutamyl-gamma-aminobutyrate hydrolase family protein [Lachnospiraceae bacterium]